MLYPSDYDKNNVKLLEPHLLLLLSFYFSSLLLFFFLVVAVVVFVSAAAAATVKRRIYEQFASRSRALNVRHELTRHSPQEQAQALGAGGAAGNGAAIADDFVNALACLRLRLRRRLPSQLWLQMRLLVAFVLRLVIYFINNKMLSATGWGGGGAAGGGEQAACWAGYGLLCARQAGRQAQTWCSMWQGLSAGLIVRKIR